MADLTWPQGESSIFKLFLHVTLAEEAAVSGCYRDGFLVKQFEDEGKEGEGSTYRSPRFLELLQSLSVVARSPRLVAPLLILASWPSMMLMASSLVRVI